MGWLRKALVASVAAFASGLTSLAAAVPVLIDVRGTIRESYYLGSGPGFGDGQQGGGTAIGQPIQFLFLFDTRFAPGDFNNGADPESAFYSDPTGPYSCNDTGSIGWMPNLIRVGGRVLTEGIIPYADPYNCDLIALRSAMAQFYDSYSQIGIASNAQDFEWANDGKNYYGSGDYSYVSVWDVPAFFNSNELLQSFSYSGPTTPDGGGFAYFQRWAGDNCGTYDTCPSADFKMFASFEVNSLTYGPLFAVPEPGTLALLGLGLVGFAFSRRRSQRVV